METDTSKTFDNVEGRSQRSEEEEVLHFHPSGSLLTALQFPVQESLPVMVARLQNEHDLIISKSSEPPSNKKIGQGINVLSSDALAIIFSKLRCLPGVDIFRAMTVCKQWRTVAVTEPKLWSHLDFSSFPGVKDEDVVRAIQRAKRGVTFFSIHNCHHISDFFLDALHDCLELEEVHIGSSQITGSGVISFLTALKLAKDSHHRIEHLLEAVDDDTVFCSALSSKIISDQQLGQHVSLQQPMLSTRHVDSSISRDPSGRHSVSSGRLQGFSGRYSESGGRSGLSGALVGIWELGVSSRRSDRASIVLSEVDAAKEEDIEPGGSMELSEDNGGIKNQSGIMLAFVNRRSVIRHRRAKMNRKLNSSSKTQDLHHLQLELLQLQMEAGDYNDDEEEAVPPQDDDDEDDDEDDLYDDYQEDVCGQEERLRKKKLSSLLEAPSSSEDSSINNQRNLKSLSRITMEGSVFEEGESSRWSTDANGEGAGCDTPRNHFSEHVIVEENRLALLQARRPKNRLALKKLWLEGVRYITFQQYDMIKSLVGWMDGAICKQCREVHLLQQCMHCDNQFCNDCRDSDQCAACGTSSCRQAPCPPITTCQACDESFCRGCRTIWECDSCCRAYCDSHLSFTQFCGIGLQYCEACVARNKLKRPFWTCIGCMG